MKNKVQLMILSLFLGCTLTGLRVLAAPENETIVTGQVTFDDGEPAAGTYVLIVGTTKGTTADENGKYSIDLAGSKTAVLEFQYMGFNTVTITVGERSKIDVVLKPSNTQLEEVVMVGYGSGVQRKDLTGSISSVSGKDIVNTPKATVTEALQGRMAGVQITTADGDVDVQTNIRVRGGTSITNSNEPLLIVDGFQVSDINNISPSNIQSVDVLKDAAATAIYGARGANGVVVITTKNAVDGAAKVSFNAYYQVNTLAKEMELLDVYEYILWNYEMDQLSTRTTAVKLYGYPDDYYIYKKYGKGYEWPDITFGKPTGTQYYNASISGGTKATSYIANIAYTYRDGIQQGTNYQRANADVRVNHTIAKNLFLSLDVRYSNTINQGISVGTISSMMYQPTAGMQAYSWSPDIDWEDEEFGDGYITDDETFGYAGLSRGYERQLQLQRKRIIDNFKAGISLKWNIIPNLTFQTSFRGILQYERNNMFYGPETSQAMYSYGGKPTINMSTGNDSQYLVTNTLNYNLKKDYHNFTVLVGQEFVNDKSFDASNVYTGFAEDITADIAYANTALGESASHSSNQSGNVRLMSFFARANYAFKDKYIVTATMRADASNKFAKQNRWGLFPAAAVAWRISNETFMKGARWINDLKLRASFGSSGNNRIGNELYMMSYKVSSDSYVPEVGGNVQNVYIPASTYLTNPGLKWETTISRNIGLDFSLFKHRLSGTIEGYWNTTKDLLVPSQIPTYAGYTMMLSNYGQTSNRGVELSLKASIIRKRNMLLDFNFNIAHNQNRIDHLANGEDYWLRSSKWSNYMKELTDFYINVGGSVGQFYGYVTDGMYTMDDFDFVDGNYILKEGVADCTNVLGYGKLLPGMLKLKKLSGEGNVVNADEDRTILGSNVPKLQGGFGLDFTWKNFDVSAFFNYMLGFQTFNAAKVAMTSVGYYGHRNMYSIVDSKHRFRYFDDVGNSLLGDPEALREFNQNATMWSPNMYAYVVHSWAVEDASFLRLNNLTIGYTLPKHHSKKIGMSQLRFYLTGANLFCLTNYSGFDPEVNVQRGLTPGIDYNGYPRSRSYTVGVNITF